MLCFSKAFTQLVRSAMYWDSGPSPEFLPMSRMSSRRAIVTGGEVLKESVLTLRIIKNVTHRFVRDEPMVVGTSFGRIILRRAEVTGGEDLKESDLILRRESLAPFCPH
jgi:hypothetical protein